MHTKCWRHHLRQNDVANALGHYAEKELMNPAFLKEKIASPEILQKAMPVIETHIDEFLHKKLKESLPVISMFIGERVLNQLKDLFVKELEKLFPVVMSGFVDDAAKSIDIKTEIYKRVSSLDIEEIEKQFYQKQGSRINQLKWLAFLFGLAVGIMELVIVYFSY